MPNKKMICQQDSSMIERLINSIYLQMSLT